MKMANKGNKPIRQTNTANQVSRAPNYNNSNIIGNKNINQRQNYNNINYNNKMNYNYPSNESEIGKNQNQYSAMKSNAYKKPITANQYNQSHNYNYNNKINANKDNIYNSPKNPKNRSYNPNHYNLNNNNYNNNYNSNYNNNYKNTNIRRNNNTYNYNNNYNNFHDNENDERPIGGGLTADQMPDESSPTSPCPHCGRNFNSQALIKHVKICEKVFLKKRKAFNTQKQRIQDSEQASLMKQGAMEEKRNPLLNNKKNGGIPKWKLQSMAFRAICNPGKNPSPNQLMNNNKNNKIIKNNMNMNNNMNNNGYGFGGGGFVNNAIAYDYKHCEFCNRNYNEEAYNKYLNFCKRRFENEKLKNKNKRTNNNTGNKNQYGSSLSGGVKYNNSKYNKK